MKLLLAVCVTPRALVMLAAEECRKLASNAMLMDRKTGCCRARQDLLIC